MAKVKQAMKRLSFEGSISRLQQSEPGLVNRQRHFRLVSAFSILHSASGTMNTAPASLGIIAGNRTLPLEFARHARAARGLAEEFFDSRKVLARLLDEVGAAA